MNDTRGVRATALACLLALGLGAPGAAARDPDLRIEPLTLSERERLQRQRDWVAALARRHVGTALRGGALGDLRVLQEILDQGLIGPERVYELQCLGVALGDVMAAQLPLRWVMVYDRRGHSRALRHRDRDDLVFPVTMISKRVTRDLPVDVRGLYDKTVAELSDR